MDGRRFRRWLLCGGVFLAAAGCKKNTYHDQFGMPKPGQTVAAIDPPGAKKSFWGGGAPALGEAPPGTPVEVVEARPKKTGPMPEFETAAADLKVSQAFADPPPPNRDAMLDVARIRYQRALKADPKHKGALLGVARMYAKLDDRERAAGAYKDYLGHYPKDAAVHHEVAVTHARWKDWAGSVSWCEAALRIDPENRTYRKTMGFCLARAGEWEKAFATLLEVMPEAQVRHNLAGLLDHLGRTDDCRQQLRMAVQVDPNFAPAREYLAELDRAAQEGPAVPQAEPDGVRTVGGSDEE